MVGTTKVLKDINNIRDEITYVIDLISKRHNPKKGMSRIMNDRAMSIAAVAVIVGLFAALFSGKFKRVIKFVLLAYTTKRSISHFFKKRK